MDSDRFDALSRRLAARVSRRTTLAGTAAALLGAFGLRARSGSAAQVSQAQCGNKRCANNPGVCNDGCVCCVFGNGNSRCMPPGNCSGTPTCPEGEIYDPNLGCVPSGPCAGQPNGVSCGTGLVCSGGQCLGNGLCATGDSFCSAGGGSGDVCNDQGTCGISRKCAATPEGGSTCVYHDDPGLGFCASGPCASSSDCADGYVCLPAGGAPCCVGHLTGTCFQVCNSASASRSAAPSGGGWGSM